MIVFSGCAASIVRLYYSIMIAREKDTTYLAGIQDLWAIAEGTCGILAICLPLAPKFFDSLQGLRIWSSHHPFTRWSKTPILQTSDTRSDEIHAAAAANLSDDGSSRLNARYQQHDYLSKHEVESNSTSSDDANDETTVRDDH